MRGSRGGPEAGAAARVGRRVASVWCEHGGMATHVITGAGSGIGAADAPYAGTLGAFTRQVISFQGEAAENAQSLAAGQEVVVNALQQRFSEGAAVNIDVEMAALLALQNSYGANARVMSTVKEMLDMLLKI